MKWYGIESRNTYHGEQFRFYSLFNGMRGAWQGKRDLAVREGEAHAGIMEYLIGCFNEEMYKLIHTLSG